MTNPTWKYYNPASLATSGIYSQEDLNRLRDHIMFPAEKPIVLNTIARGIMGHATLNQGASLINLLDEKTLNKIAESAWGKFWSVFTNFETASASMIGIIIIIRGIKLIADTLIHGYALHNMFGWSFHLLGALGDSVTNLLLHLGTTRSTSTQPNSTPPDSEQIDHSNNSDEQKKLDNQTGNSEKQTNQYIYFLL